MCCSRHIFTSIADPFICDFKLLLLLHSPLLLLVRQLNVLCVLNEHTFPN